jgi:hypothetical protein
MTLKIVASLLVAFLWASPTALNVLALHCQDLKDADTKCFDDNGCGDTNRRLEQDLEEDCQQFTQITCREYSKCPVCADEFYAFQECFSLFYFGDLECVPKPNTDECNGVAFDITADDDFNYYDDDDDFNSNDYDDDVALEPKKSGKSGKGSKSGKSGKSGKSSKSFTNGRV